jgi:hypothetical protein
VYVTHSHQQNGKIFITVKGVTQGLKPALHDYIPTASQRPTSGIYFIAEKITVYSFF